MSKEVIYAPTEIDTVGKLCKEYCDFFDGNACTLFEVSLRKSKIRDLDNVNMYYRCKGCLDSKVLKT